MDLDPDRRQDQDPTPAEIESGGRVLRAVVRAARVRLPYPARGTVEYAPEGDLGDIEIGAPVERGHDGPIVGIVTGATRTPRALTVEMRIDDADTLAAIDAGGLPHVSADYRVGRLDSDGAQRGVTIRAIALVPRGRCGEACSVRKDDSGACYDTNAPHTSGVFLEKAPMAKIKIAGKEFDAASPEAVAALEAEAKRLDALDQTFRAHRTAALRAQVKAATGLDVRKDADDQSVMVETVKKIVPGVDLSSASPDYIAGAFAVAIAMALDLKAKEEGEPDAPDAPDAPAKPPAEGAPRADSIRADVFEARKPPEAKTAPAAAYTMPPDVLARQRMIERGHRLGASVKP